MSGEDLVLLHGWGMHGGIWDGMKERLAGRFNVHAVDLPGYGETASVSPYALEALAASLARRFAGPVHVCGWSLGGMLAQRWAVDFPEQVQSLVLVASTPRFVSGGGWDHGVEQPILKAFAAGLEGDYEGTLKRFLSLQAKGDEEVREVTRALRASLFERGRPEVEALRGGLAILRDADLRSEAGRIACPTLLVHGDRDTLTPLPAAHWLEQTLPAARLALVHGAAHAPFISHRDEFVRVVAGFLHV